MKLQAQMATPQFELTSMVTYLCQYVWHTVNNKNIKQYKTSLFFLINLSNTTYKSDI